MVSYSRPKMTSKYNKAYHKSNFLGGLAQLARASDLHTHLV